MRHRTGTIYLAVMRRKWTEEEDAVLRGRYGTIPAEEIAGQLQRSVRSVYGRAQLLGLRCPESYRSEAGKKGSASPEAVSHRFMKGHISANRGKKMSPEVYVKCSSTMFRKGNIPVNTKPVGSERLTKDGYMAVKTAEPNVWKLKHRLIWEQVHGPIPEGSNVQFRNGNRQDIRIENLYLISRAEQMKGENSLCARYPEGLQKAIRARGALKRQITLYNKKQK